MNEHEQAVAELYRERPRSLLVRFTSFGIVVLGAVALLTGEVSFAAMFDPRRHQNIARFLQHDLTPYPLREGGFSWGELGAWAWDIWLERGAKAMMATLFISLLAIVLAGAAGALLSPFGARSLMTSEPFARGSAKARELRELPWRLVALTARVLGVFLRAIPEYVWAFLLLAILGPNAWPVILALAIHNAGILGRLGADTLENLESAPLRALHGLGANRRQVVVDAALPSALPRYLLYFFYRYETCVREATVLGMLGVISLGYWIEDARTRLRYDDMLFLVLLGSVLVMLGDLASMAARSWIRRAR